jgi:hypothetical protein
MPVGESYDLVNAILPLVNSSRKTAKLSAGNFPDASVV